MVQQTLDKAHITYFPVKKQNQENVKLPLLGIRHLQILLLFVLIFTGFGFRVILSVCIVAMTDPNASINPDVPVYQWKEKGAILSAFFWGYLTPQIFAGYAANRYGAKWFLIVAMLVQSLLAVLTPATAEFLGPIGLCISRAIQGFCQGFFFPSVMHQLSQWVPHEERGRLGSFVFGAGPFGTVVAILIAGLISASWYGWPLVFYIYGAIGIIWTILFFFLGSNSPAEHLTISEAEKLYIEKSLGHTDEKPIHKVPWLRIVKSVPVWTILIVQTGAGYSFWLLLTQIPTYMNKVMAFDIKSNSFLSCLPYITLWLLSFLFGYLSDLITNKNLVTTGTSRKIFNTIGLIVPAIALVILSYTGADQKTQAVILLIVAVSANAACMSGWQLNHMDLSPNFAGTLMGFTNGLSHISAILAPITVQIFVKDETDPSQWRTIFLISAALLVAVAVDFIIFAKGEVQPWNEDNEQEQTPTKSV